MSMTIYVHYKRNRLNKSNSFLISLVRIFSYIAINSLYWHFYLKRRIDSVIDHNWNKINLLVTYYERTLIDLKVAVHFYSRRILTIYNLAELLHSDWNSDYSSELIRNLNHALLRFRWGYYFCQLLLVSNRSCIEKVILHRSVKLFLFLLNWTRNPKRND